MKFWKFAMLCAGASLAAVVLTAPAKASPAEDGAAAVAFISKCEPDNLTFRNNVVGCLYKNRAGDTMVMWAGGEVETVNEAPPPAPKKPAARIVYRDQYGRPTESPVDICTRAIRAGAPVTPYCQNAMAREIMMEMRQR